MRRRPDRERGARGSGSRGPVSPFIPSAGVRRRRRGGWLVLILLLLLVVGAGAVAMVASATKRTSAARGVSTLATPNPAPTDPSTRDHHRPRSAFGTRLEDRAIDRVLAYTPFIRAGLPRRRVIALTFDDGPSPYTPQIVSVLVRMRAAATFFVVGQQLDYFSAGLRDELRHGFVVGDHTENHPPLISLSQAGQYAQINTAGERIRHVGATFPRLFRPPYGL